MKPEVGIYLLGRIYDLAEDRRQPGEIFPIFPENGMQSEENWAEEERWGIKNLSMQICHCFGYI